MSESSWSIENYGRYRQLQKSTDKKYKPLSLQFWASESAKKQQYIAFKVNGFFVTHQRVLSGTVRQSKPLNLTATPFIRKTINEVLEEVKFLIKMGRFRPERMFLGVPFNPGSVTPKGPNDQ